METTYLVMLIVSLIILLALSFFIFQIWVHSKETKLQIASFIQEQQKGFTSNDETLKQGLISIKENLSQIDNNIKIYKEEIVHQVTALSNSSDTKLNDSFEALKIKSLNRLEELDNTIKLFKEQIENRMKEVDKHLTGKLVEDLTNITKQYSTQLSEMHNESISKFSKISNEIKDEQKRLLKAITEPLQLKSNNND